METAENFAVKTSLNNDPVIFHTQIGTSQGKNISPEVLDSIPIREYNVKYRKCLANYQEE